MANRRLSDEAIDLIAARLRVIAEPNRIRILGLLNEGEATVQELTDRLMTTHQNVSKHLGVLYQGRHGEPLQGGQRSSSAHRRHSSGIAPRPAATGPRRAAIGGPRGSVSAPSPARLSLWGNRSRAPTGARCDCRLRLRRIRSRVIG